MAKKSSEFLKALGRYFEISKAVLNAVLDQGGTDDDLARILSDAELRREIARLIVAKSAKLAFPSLTLAADLIPSGYTVVEDVAPTLKSIGDLDLASFLEPGESYVNGETMRQRAVVLKANLGLADLKVALADQAKISEEAKPFYIVFPGTVLRDPDGRLCVAYLSWGGDLCVAYLGWDDDRWVVDFDRVASDWDDDDRLARCK